MEKRESKRQRTLPWGNLSAKAKIGGYSLKLPILDISIGGMGVLVRDGLSLLQEGRDIHIVTLENKGKVIAADIHGRVAYVGPGIPSRVGIEFSPAETPIEAYAKLHSTKGDKGKLITDREEIMRIFSEVKKWSRGFGDMLMVSKQKAIPTEFFYLRPAQDNILMRIVRMSEFRLPFQPVPGNVYPFYIFKGINVMLFHAKVLSVIKSIMETNWPETVQHISRRSVLRYFITGDEPMTATVSHPITMEKTPVLVWDLSIEGMGAEVLDEKSPIIEGMNLPVIRINLPKGPVEAAGVVRSVRRENVLEKTQLGIEFIGGSENFRDKILGYILNMDFPPETVIGRP
ncbi:MAG TPA: PilZ domain-containing protein [Deltaproteobacteria bacterium]|jgi:c-di-GMP-binding flagellar brake protein YcgR|nr:PilZ domain-containing protein [Deltaproteobacteria bacterium]HQJ08102.1 PilZ domain-containing protein [Deltaproteobacteria bacterium]